MMDKSITDFDEWDLLGIPEDKFFHHYDNNLDLKERLDDIYTLCDEKKYLIEEHLNNLTI